MKKNIVVCCEKMLRALHYQHVFYDGKLAITPTMPPNAHNMQDFEFCPWCGKKLPFECEESDN